MNLTRRQFIRTSAAVLAAPGLSHATSGDAFSFVLLGDLHYDKLEHHDMAWLEKHKAGDLSQITNYTRITAELTPRLLASVRETVAVTKAAMVVQVGDFVEGLCGTEALAARQNREAIDFVNAMKLGAPFLFTKGNHDVTGDGAVEAFRGVFHPFIEEQSRGFHGSSRKVDGACHAVEYAGALFCFFDAYDRESLDWLEAELDRRTARHCFVIIHPPVVPYGARATWHLYSSERDRPRREKLLALLGKNRAIVLGGHIHRYNTLARETPGGGRFAQLAISSVVNNADVRPATELSGIGEYNGDQIRVEPGHSPETSEARRAVYAAEAPFVKAFEYAELPGHAVVTVDGERVMATMHRGITREVWKTADLTALLASR